MCVFYRGCVCVQIWCNTILLSGVCVCVLSGVCVCSMGVCVGVCALSHVQLFATPWTVTCRLLCPWNFLGKNTKWVAMSYFRGFSWPRNRTCISWVSCIGKRILYHCSTWEALCRIQRIPLGEVLVIYFPCMYLSFLDTSFIL